MVIGLVVPAFADTEIQMDFEQYLTERPDVPLSDRMAFSASLRPQRERSASTELTKEAKMGILKLMMVKKAEGENAEQLRAAMLVDPQVQKALDFKEAQQAAAALSQQNQQMQQQMAAMMQGMQQLQQQAVAAGQQNQALQQQLQGEMQMRQQANMQALQANDQALKTQAASQQQRMQLAQTADQAAIALKQVASQDPVQQMQQQEQQAAQEQQMQQAAQLAAMPPEQRKEVEQAQKAQQEAQVQGQQAQQEAQKQEIQQGAQQQQQGMVAQSAAGMSKTDFLRAKLAKCKGKPRRPAGRVEKTSEIYKRASLPGATTPFKQRLIEAGIGAGLGATAGIGFALAQRRFGEDSRDKPSPEEIALEKKQRAASIAAQTNPSMINRIAAIRAQAQLDAERDVRKSPNKQLIRRAAQGAAIGSAAAPTVMMAQRNLGPRILG